jgi:hypothetical protein
MNPPHPSLSMGLSDRLTGLNPARSNERLCGSRWAMGGVTEL